MADPLTAAVSERICRHMNEDHASAVALYAQAFGGVSSVTVAEMVAIDAGGMDLRVVSEGEERLIRIPFDRPLRDSEEAHHTLVDMLKQARAQVGSQHS
ncbi:MAG: DUF2470 domain-containing protein [Thermostichales cyanobacterium SZTDM-1c_bins_54]